MRVRFAGQTAQLEQAAAFYRDRLGLPELGRFNDHDGFDGVFLDLPGTRAHLELVSAPHCAPPQPHPETLLVLYLGSWNAVHERVRQGRLTTVPAANPYWDAHGLTVTDPDGWRVVLCADQGAH